MHLSKIHLRNFRTYEAALIELSPGINIVYGPNATGKTNLLEAIYLLATGSSPRTARDADLVQAGKSSFYLKGLVERNPLPITIEVAGEPGRGKAARVNGKPAGSAALCTYFPVVYFAPKEMGVVSGTPGSRRAFLDRVCCYLDPAYAHHLFQFRYVIEQRNALLRGIKERRESKELLTVWDEQLADHGAHVLSWRVRAVRDMAGILREEYRFICDREEPGLSYCSFGFRLNDLMDAGIAEIANIYAAALEKVRDEEVARGFTLIGPHRDDLLITMDGLDARFFASQGQVRSLTLALKLAAARLIEDVSGVQPVMLLDDVLSEFDRGRREALLTRLAACDQVVITCADTAEIEKESLQRANLISVTRGGGVFAPAREKAGQTAG